MWPRERSVEEKWETLHSSLAESGEALLGTVGNRDVLVKFREARGEARRKR